MSEFPPSLACVANQTGADAQPQHGPRSLLGPTGLFPEYPRGHLVWASPSVARVVLCGLSAPLGVVMVYVFTFLPSLTSEARRALYVTFRRRLSSNG